MIDNKQKIDKVVIINSKDNIKEYELENKKMTIEQIINNINSNLKNDKHIKQINKIYFKYKNRFKDLDEKLKTDKKVREIFLQELNEELENINEKEKETIINKTNNIFNPKKIEIDNYLNFDNMLEFFVLHIPQLILETSVETGKTTLMLLSNTLINKVKENTINRVKDELKINIQEITKEEYNELKNEVKQEQKNNIDNNLLKELEQLKNENKQLKQENKELKLYTNKVLNEVSKMKQNFKSYDNFVKNELLTTLQQTTKQNLKQEQKENLKQDLTLKTKMLNNFKPF